MEKSTALFLAMLFGRFIVFGLLLVFGGQSVAGSPDLVPLGPFGGDVRSLATHRLRPDRVFLGTADGQIFVSENWGRHWKKLMPGLSRRELVLDGLVFHPDNPDFLFAGGWELKSDRGGLYRTRDAGRSWQKVDLGIFESSIRAVAVSPVNPNHVAVGITEGVLLSRDGGNSWDRISRGYRSLHNVHSLAFDPQDENTLYVGTWRLAWKTNTLGKKWIPMHKGMYWDSDLFSIQVDPGNPAVLFAGACSGFYRSTNSGESWVRLRNGIPSEAKRTRVVRVDPENSDLVYAGTTAGLYVSKDGGDSWSCTLPEVTVNALIIDPRDGRHLLLGTDDAGVLSSSDRGRNFIPANTGFSQRQIAAVAVRPGSDQEYFAAAVLDSHHGGFFRTSDGGRSWESLNDGLKDAVGGIRVILPARSSQSVYLGTIEGVYRGQPGLQPWERVEGTEGLFINGLQFSGSGEKKLFIAARQGVFFLDFEKELLTRLTIPVYDREVFAVFVDRIEGLVYVGTDMGIFSSADQGKTWTIRVEGLPYTTVNTIIRIGARLFAGTKVGVFYSDDSGQKWGPVSGVFPIDIVAVQGDSDSGEVFAADPLVGYLFTSSDLGLNWEAMPVGLALSRISALTRTPSGEFLAATVAEGVYRIVPQPRKPGGKETDAPVE